MGIMLNLYINLGRTDILTGSISPITQTFFHFTQQSYVVFSIWVLYFVKLIPKFDAIANEIILMPLWMKLFHIHTVYW